MSTLIEYFHIVKSAHISLDQPQSLTHADFVGFFYLSTQTLMARHGKTKLKAAL
jgi:hypothetical protein